MKSLGNFKKPFGLAFIVIWLFSQYFGPNFVFAQATERFHVTATARVRVGNPPDLCGIIELQDGGQTWSEAEKGWMNNLCQDLASAPDFVGLLINAGTITITRQPDRGFSTTSGNNISFAVATSDYNAFGYAVTHELGHVLGNYNGDVFANFLLSGAFSQERLVATYPSGDGFGDPEGESFAEMIVDYVFAKRYNFPPRRWSCYPGGVWTNPGGRRLCTGPAYTTFQNDYSQHYNFAKNNIFGGFEF